MQVRSHSRKFEVRVENVLGHVVRIRTRKPYAFHSFDFRYGFKEFAEGGFRSGRSERPRIPRQRFGIPKLGFSIFSITVDVLSEQGDFFRSRTHGFADFFDDFLEASRFLASASVGNDAETAKIIAAGLDDDVGNRRIFPQLPHFQIFFPFFIVSDIGSGNDGKEFRQMAGLFDSEDEIRVRHSDEKVVVPIEYRFGRGKQRYLSKDRFSFRSGFEMASRDARFPYHASRDADEDVFFEAFRKPPYFGGVSKHPVFSLLADAAGIENDDVRHGRIEDFSESGLQKRHVHLFGIGVIHLAAEGLHEVGFQGFSRHGTSDFRIKNVAKSMRFDGFVN